MTRLIRITLLGTLIGTATLVGLHSNGGRLLGEYPAWARLTKDTNSDPTSTNAADGAANGVPTSVAGQLQRLLTLVDAQRAAAGCAALRLDNRLTTVATEQAHSMAANLYVSHTDLEGRNPQQRGAAVGYPGRVQESLAVGIQQADDVVAAWLNPTTAAPLKARLHNCALVAAGVAYQPDQIASAYGPGIWVLDLGDA